MNVVPALGSLSLGIVIGWLVRYFIRRFKRFTPATLTTVISIMAGGAAVKFLQADKTVLWFYPVGLLLGFCIYTVLALWALGLPRSRASKQASERSKDECKSSRSIPEDHFYNGVLYKPKSNGDNNSEDS